MLDASTKSRIDSARDILVGKVPDPKSQVEQITIAMIYKFMDDMDRQSEELGGKATFFTGDFKKYRWAQLLDKRYSGHERLLLYAEGIEKMNVNKNIPQLFRDIFKGVFLPYRDPETLNLFLKEIDGFSYDHSERLGDAFEYLLSVLGTQGDAGQFRTPRHIIDFIVAVVDPKKTETILDPACGTAGFLISAYKHILAPNRHGAGGTAPSKVTDGGPGYTPAESAALSPDERARLMTNFRGYDIAPDMVRLARANLYLHGFPNPVLHEYDTLTSEERWDERCDMILANPPFMTPKGGIRPHNRFSIPAKRSEVLFVDYIAEHLNPGGRAGVIVPEGIIFQSQNAYKQLRKKLVENYLWAVVSLPAGVFNPYSGVKTSILFLDRNLARRSDEVLFVKIENDGFDLGAQRRPVEGGDLPVALKVLMESRVTPRPLDGAVPPALGSVPHGGPGYIPARSAPNPAGVEAGPPVIRVPRAHLLESPDINLSGYRYRVAAPRHTGKWPMVKLGEVCSFVTGGTPKSTVKEYYENGTVPWLVSGDIHKGEIRECDGRITERGVQESNAKVLPVNSVLIALNGQGKTRGTVALLRMAGTTCNQSLVSMIPLPGSALKSEFLFHVLRGTYEQIRQLTGDEERSGLNMPILRTIELPLPPLDEQERIVAELEGYRKVIEGARQILAAYKPTIRIDPGWPVVKLGEVIKTITPPKKIQKATFADKGRYPVIDQSQVEMAGWTDDQEAILPVTRPLVIFGDHTCAVKFVDRPFAQGADGIKIIETGVNLLPEFLFYFLQAFPLQTEGYKRHFLSLVRLPIALPPLAIQRQIVAELEAERKLVEANRELIVRMEAKIKAKLAEVWSE